MRAWTVHTKSVAAAAVGGGAAPQVAAPALVPERFSWAALAFGPLWLLWHGLWIALLGWLVLALGCALLPAALAPWAFLALQLLLAAQAQDLRRWALSRRGWQLAGVVLGADEEAALLRLLTARPELAGWVAR